MMPSLKKLLKENKYPSIIKEYLFNFNRENFLWLYLKFSKSYYRTQSAHRSFWLEFRLTFACFKHVLTFYKKIMTFGWLLMVWRVLDSLIEQLVWREYRVLEEKLLVFRLHYFSCWDTRMMRNFINCGK